MLKKLYLTEDDLRRELVGALRWDKFVLQQATDKVLREMFEKNVDMFNGARVQARHVLVGVEGGKKAEAEAKVQAIRKQIDAEVSQAVAKLPANADKITQEKERVKALEKAFAAAALRDSICPSRQQGGDLGYFQRTGAMVEPFARAAFALKPYQMSEPVTTEFGVHLILCVDYRPGKDVKFEDVRAFVQENYAERLREAILTSYKPKAKIEIREKKKTP
jgi:parvulin-like peptidyl-prolyl isomerase